MRQSVHTLDELISKTINFNDQRGSHNYWNDLEITIEEEKTLFIPFPMGKIKMENRNLINNNLRIKFVNCHFYNLIDFRGYEKGLWFVNCVFHKKVSFKNRTYPGKMRFHSCVFKGDVNFVNATFNELADFWFSKFKNPLILYKTDFHNTAVFSATQFNENVLFTYTLISKLIIFRGTKFKKGLDLSLAIISGELSVFDVELQNFNTNTSYLVEEDFEKHVGTTGDIPIKNKRETYRILKKYFETNNNIAESLHFNVLEKRTLSKENRYELSRLSKLQYDELGIWKIISLKIKSFFNLFVLTANYVSSYFGVAYIQSLIFTLAMGGICYYLTIMQTDLYDFAWNFDMQIFKENIPEYANYLLPTHKFDFLGEDFLKTHEISKWFYVWDIAGRMAIGYGIYQTIQAFRKFR